jgi:hypothetical protein
VFNRIIFADRTSGAAGDVGARATVGAKASVGAEGAGQPASNGGGGLLSGSVGGAGGNGDSGDSSSHAPTGHDDSSTAEHLVPEPRY